MSRRLTTLKLSYFRKHVIRCFVITTIGMWIRFKTQPSLLYCRYRKLFFLCLLPLSPFFSLFLLKDLLIILMALFHCRFLCGIERQGILNCGLTYQWKAGIVANFKNGGISRYSPGGNVENNGIPQLYRRTQCLQLY